MLREQVIDVLLHLVEEANLELAPDEPLERGKGLVECLVGTGDAIVLLGGQAHRVVGAALGQGVEDEVVVGVAVRAVDALAACEDACGRKEIGGVVVRVPLLVLTHILRLVLGESPLELPLEFVELQDAHEAVGDLDGGADVSARVVGYGEVVHTAPLPSALGEILGNVLDCDGREQQGRDVAAPLAQRLLSRVDVG